MDAMDAAVLLRSRDAQLRDLEMIDLQGLEPQ